MKINDLITFVAAAKAPSLRQAAAVLDVQPGTLSKIIKRIESHYQQELFDRRGGKWQLTSSGEMLYQRATELVAVHDKIERELGKPRRPHLRVSGSETLLSHFVPSLMQRFVDKNLQVTMEAKVSQDLAMLTKHEVDLAIIASLSKHAPQEPQIKIQALSQVNFVTVANNFHPIVQQQRDEIDINEVLNHPFIVPSKPIYGVMDVQRNHDGWHDEHFSRQITARVDTASGLVSMVKYQPLLAYVPDYIAQEHNLKVLTVTGCPYTCEQTIWLCQHQQIQHHWMRVFED